MSELTGVEEKTDWLEKKRLDDRGKLAIGEFIGVETVGHGSDGDIGMSEHLLADA